jgi:RNA polymerase sigma-70 factor (ECF subfamily)
MSLDISTGAGAWQKGYRLAARAFVPAAPRRNAIAGLMDARTGTAPEPNMSALLVRIGQTRDVELFELLFRHFAPRVKAYMARTGSAVSAEELMQETMVAVWNKAALYDPARGAASTWIFSIARNLRIDAYRREKHPEFDENDPAFQPPAEPAADHRLEGEQSAQLVRAALEALPPDQAEVMRLAFYEDSSQSEIAAALALPLGTVKSRMRLAFGKLRAALGQTGDLT